MPHRIFAIALNTFREAVRDRVLYGIVFFAIAILGFAVALGEVTLGQERRVLYDVGTAAVSLFAVVTALFLGVSLLHKEIDKKTLYIVLTKPIGRGEFVVGKYLGMVATGIAQIALMSAVLLLLLRGYGTQHAIDADPPVAYAAVLALAEYLVVSALALLYSSFSSPFVGGLMTGLTFVLGRLVPMMTHFADRHPSRDLRRVLGVAIHVVPNLSLFVPSRSTLVPYIPGYAPEGYVLKAAGYGVLYAAILVGLSILVFRRRDLI